LLIRHLPNSPCAILDVGGGPGGHALWLAANGYEVHLIDIVPLHVNMAKEASNRQKNQLASIDVGDARSLNMRENAFDIVLMFGPLYHLTERKDRLTALNEAKRVLKPGGMLFAVAISKYASTLDGIRMGYIEDPDFREIIEGDLNNGQHRNNTGNPAYFTNTFFHHPDELMEEFNETEFQNCKLYGVEGPCWLIDEFDDWWEDQERRNFILNIARKTERDSCMLEAGAHIMAIGNKANE
jgi:ubiquinone/menaquinone biosynthesis C-methylase UbiE